MNRSSKYCGPKSLSAGFRVGIDRQATPIVMRLNLKLIRDMVFTQ
jgi:hypothetical protein